MADHKLHVARVIIEYEFAFQAEPGESAEVVARRLIDESADDLSALQDFADVTVRPAAPGYVLPAGGGVDDIVYRSRRNALGISHSWAEVVTSEQKDTT